MVEWVWLQKSRVNWVLKGDKNTKFFHVMAASRNNRNALCSLSVNGVIKENPADIRAEVLLHYRRLFFESWFSRPSLSGHFQSIGGDEVRAALEVEFLESEVLAAVKTCDGNKAPRLDGFNLMLFQKCWQSIKGDVMQFMSEFHQNSKLVHGINSSFVALIPKNDNPTCLSDYRPISLIGSLYRVLAKVLSNRIKLIVSRIISESQSAFIGGRSILDGVLIANEIVDGWKKNQRKGIVLKLDFEKAYDSINWEFLFSMLASFGFGSKWIKWMQECVSSAKISILVNGSPASEFSPQRGLRQGDPLSPFLFNIVAEGLNILMTRARLMGLIKGAVVGSNDLSITHLQLIDELSKEYASVLNCVHQSLPLNYLGMPLGGNPRRRWAWKPIIDKVNQKLASWKKEVLIFCCKYGEIGGGWWPLLVKGPRLSLVWRDIQGIAAHWPQLVEFFKINISFIVGDGRNIRFWLHNWVGNVCLKDEFPRLYSVPLDKNESVERLSSRRNGNEEWKLVFRRALFQWELEDLRRLRIMLLNAPTIRDGMVDRLKWNARNSGVFTMSSAYEWSAASVEASSNLVGCIWKNLAPPIRDGMVDRLKWNARNYGVFTMSSAYEWSASSVEASSNLVGCIWKNLAPPKVQLFGWLAWKERIKTTSYLQRLGVLNAASDINCQILSEGMISSGFDFSGAYVTLPAAVWLFSSPSYHGLIKGNGFFFLVLMGGVCCFGLGCYREHYVLLEGFKPNANLWNAELVFKAA
ncbi:uncharacterized protein LOC114295281 [Camellia sinensis]|uniref:uncharacterized protein LOC114295281 n=1 Tax=Camellia sinensis TaxID=4442 RepID=UPI0010358165|nr:uncharacterized protein LOC114295281 [Camellia sinensis]